MLQIRYKLPFYDLGVEAFCCPPPKSKTITTTTTAITTTAATITTLTTYVGKFRKVFNFAAVVENMAFFLDYDWTKIYYLPNFFTLHENANDFSKGMTYFP